MPQVLDLETINTGVKAVTSVLVDSNTANEYAWLDRIANLLDKVTQFAGVYKQMQTTQPQAQADRHPPDNFQPPRPQPAGTIGQPLEAAKDKKAMQMLKFVIPVLDTYLDKCIKENPQMTIGEAIAKLDIMHVTELKELMRLYRQSNGL